MPKRRLGAEQIVTKRRQVEVLQSQGKSVAAACKEAGLHWPMTSSRWPIHFPHSTLTGRECMRGLPN